MVKHEEIAGKIRELILSGEGVAQDGQLISERNLAERFGVSRTTVRKAIDSLSREGMLIQIHGRGTFVKNIRDFKYSQSLYSVIRCSQYYEEQGLIPNISVLRQEVRTASDTVASYLKIQPGAPVLRIEKLFQAQRLTFNVTISYVSLTEFPDAQKEDYSRPICEVLRDRYGVYPRKTDNTIEAILPPKDIAATLQITENTPLLLFESLTTGVRNGRILPVEYFKTYHRTDRLRFSFSQDHDDFL